jgi:hypothetical protein
MSNRLGHTQKLNPADIASEPFEQLDLLVADPTDSQILDEQVVPDVLDEIDTDATSAMKVLETRAMVEKMTEGSTVLHDYQPKAVRVNWMRRVCKGLRLRKTR